VEELGRVLIPIALRRTLNINEKDALEIYVENDRIILHKYEPVDECIFCGNTENISLFREKSICGNCLKELPK